MAACQKPDKVLVPVQPREETPSPPTYTPPGKQDSPQSPEATGMGSKPPLTRTGVKAGLVVWL